MAERLFGLETEYALTVLDRRGAALDRLPVLRRTIELARRRYAHLLDTTGRGIFLTSGARLYVDYPDHAEFATPEVGNPWDVVRYAQAGDRLLGELLAEVAASLPEVKDVVLSRCNVDYGGTGNSWGCHESYLYTSDPRDLPQQIIPHLVSRVIYTGAGGFDSLLPGGAEFTLSPRVPHLQHAISAESMHTRGIFHTKDEPMAARGYHRLHILCGESLCSETAAWLKVATTALVVALIDHGLRPGDRVTLTAPVHAMRTFAVDPTCKARARLATGRMASALAIQRHYLELVQARVDEDFMPAWAGEACSRWQAVLDRLEGAPDSVSTTLDWAIKLALFQQRARQQGVDWAALDPWNRAVWATRGAADAVPDSRNHLLRMVRGVPAPSAADDLACVGPQLERDGQDPRAFARLPHLCRELCEIDVRFAQVGPRGVFAALDHAGVLAHRVPGVDNIEHAMAHPPAVGRARVRGDWVGRLSERAAQCACDWQAVFDPEGRRKLDLSDPFGAGAEWTAWEPLMSPARRPQRVELDL